MSDDISSTKSKANEGPVSHFATLKKFLEVHQPHPTGRPERHNTDPESVCCILMTLTKEKAKTKTNNKIGDESVSPAQIPPMQLHFKTRREDITQKKMKKKTYLRHFNDCLRVPVREINAARSWRSPNRGRGFFLSFQLASLAYTNNILLGVNQC